MTDQTAAPTSSLWKHPDFLKLWSGETISLLGSQVTLLALPLTATLILHATAPEMGILGAVEFAPFLLIGLFAGVWVDRLRRRPILIIADIGRALLLGTIPLAALLNVLSIGQLYVVSFLVGILTVFFDVSYQSYLPALVPRSELVDGNSKLEVSRSIAQIAGPAIAGQLIQFIVAPLAIFIDALSFLASALFLGLIRQHEPDPQAALHPSEAGQPRNMRREIGEGLHIIVDNPLLRSIAGSTATSNLFTAIIGAVFILYVTNPTGNSAFTSGLGLSAGTLGLIYGLASVGGLIGALLANRMARRIGVGATIIVGMFIGGVGTLLIPFASGAVASLLLIAAQFLMAMGSTVYNITQVSLRQNITPDRLQGRMNASMRFMVWGTMPIGSLIGGALGSLIGLQPTMIIGAVGASLAFLWVLLSPIRALREQPPPADPVIVA